MKPSLSRLILPLLSAATVFTSTTQAKLVAWYPLDESPSAPLAVQENISGNDATLIGYDADPALSWVTRGVPSARQNLGLAYRFEKNDTLPAGGGLNLGMNSSVQPTDKFTISFFFQPGTLTTFDRFLETLVGNSNDIHGLRIDTGAAANGVRVLVRSANGTNSQFTHPLVLRNDGTWYFFSFRYDSAGIDNSPFQLTLLEMDGSTVDEAAIAAATQGLEAAVTGAIAATHAGPALVGVELPDGANPNNINAVIDEYAFFDNSDGNGVLTNEQLVDVFNFGPSGIELIKSFTSDLESVTVGESATLSWEVAEPFDSLILDDGNGNTTDLAPMTTAGSGSVSVSPTEPTTYSIRATRGDASNVFTLNVLAGVAPEIASFTPSAPLIQLGSSVDLTWNVVGADSLVLNPGSIDVLAATTTTLSPPETTTYTLTAMNESGTSTSTLTVEVLTGPLPVHRFVAGTTGNTDLVWFDQVGLRRLDFTGGILNSPLTTPSANTTINAAFSTGGGINGAVTPTFNPAEFSIEIWFRPGELTVDHQTIFETGGGQNGLSALITDSELRLLGSSLNQRTLDATIPIDGLNLEDFLQLVITNDSDNDLYTASLRDTFGNVRTVSEAVDVTLGGNGAGLFIWGAGAVNVGEINLGGRTEAGDASPAGLTGFAGEIGIVNVYEQILDETAIQAAFSRVATIGVGPSGLAVTKVSFDDAADQLTITWNSINGQSYLVEFSTSLKSDEWFELGGPFVADGAETTTQLTLPQNQTRFFVRVVLDNQ